MDASPSVNIRRFSRGDYSDYAPTTVMPTIAEEEEPTIAADDDDFLADLKGDYTTTTEEPPKSPPPKKRGRKPKAVPEVTELAAVPQQTPPKTKSKAPKDDTDFSGLYGTPTPILGKEKRQLLTRISMLKQMFPAELKSFKVSPKADAAELERAIDEMECISSCGSLNSMMKDSVLAAIRVVEGVSSRTDNYDISGTADILAQSEDFVRLCKLLVVKHKVWAQVPPEMQLCLLVFSVAAVQRQKNKMKSQVSGILFNRDI